MKEENFSSLGVLYRRMYKLFAIMKASTEKQPRFRENKEEDSMVRIISPKGQLLYVEQIQPVCEMQIMFNGQKVTLMDRARDWSAEPTALAMQIRQQQNELVVGNLKPETVREIVRILGEKEYFDFSTLAYQDEMTLNKVILDGGKSAAYNSYSLFGGGFWHDFCERSCHEMDICDGGGELWMSPKIPMVDIEPDALNWESMK